MQILVRGFDGKIKTLDCDPHETILAFKTRLSAKYKAENEWDISPVHMSLNNGVSQLRDDRTLADYAIHRFATLHLSLRL
jgi:hypothetical protein